MGCAAGQKISAFCFTLSPPPDYSTKQVFKATAYNPSKERSTLCGTSPTLLSVTLHYLRIVGQRVKPEGRRPWCTATTTPHAPRICLDKQVAASYLRPALSLTLLSDLAVKLSDQLRPPFDFYPPLLVLCTTRPRQTVELCSPRTLLKHKVPYIPSFGRLRDPTTSLSASRYQLRELTASLAACGYLRGAQKRDQHSCLRTLSPMIALGMGWPMTYRLDFDD